MTTMRMQNKIQTAKYKAREQHRTEACFANIYDKFSQRAEYDAFEQTARECVREEEQSL